MYKLVIADDVVGVHQLLKQIIDKTNLGFEVIGCFSNGIDTIEFLKKTEVDVIITDIKMPLSSGLEIAKFVYDNRFKTKVVILSAYAEFNYAVEAINYNVFQYIMKPINFFELKNTLKRVKNIIENESMARYEDIDIERECFLNDLLSGSIDNKEWLEKRYNRLNFKTNINNTYISIYEIQFTNYSYVLEKIWKYGVEYFNRALMDVICGTIRDYADGDVVVLFCDSETMIFAFVGDMLNKDIFKNLKSYFSEFMQLGIEPVKSNENLKLIDLNEQLDDGMAEFFRKYNNSRNYIDNSDKNNANLVEQTDSAVYDNMIDKVKSYVRDHISEEEITRDKMADMLYFTGAHFSKLFKKITGITFSEYVLSERMRLAMELLKTNIKISNIPAKVGYGSYRHFQRVFRNYYGYSPSEYRKKIIGEIIDGTEEKEDFS